MKLTKTLATLTFACMAGVVVAATPAQEAVVQTSNGQSLKVVTSNDGTITVVMPDGTVLTGQAALDALTNAGVTVTVSPLGTITGVRGASSVSPVTPVSKATADQIAPAVSQTVEETVPGSSGSASDVALPGSTAGVSAGAVADSVREALPATGNETTLNEVHQRVEEGKANPSTDPSASK